MMIMPNRENEGVYQVVHYIHLLALLVQRNNCNSGAEKKLNRCLKCLDRLRFSSADLAEGVAGLSNSSTQFGKSFPSQKLQVGAKNFLRSRISSKKNVISHVCFSSILWLTYKKLLIYDYASFFLINAQNITYLPDNQLSHIECCKISRTRSH